MLVQGNVISYNPNTKVAKNGGGTYDAWELVYRDMESVVKTVAKPVQGLRFNSSLKNGLAELRPGDDFTLTMEKKGQFWEAQSVQKGIMQTQEDATPPAATRDGNRTAATGGKVTGSNYETPEERAKKQVLIIRQSSVRDAIELVSKNQDVTLEKVLETAKELEKHVWKDFSKLAKKYMEVDLKEAE